MSFRSRLSWLVLLMWMLCGKAGATPVAPPPLFGAEPMTLDGALQMAVTRNSTLAVARAQEREAWYAWHQAGALPNLEVSANYVGGTVSNVTNNNGTQDLSMQLTQSLGPIGSLHQASKVGMLGYEQAQASTAEVRNTLEQNLKDAFFTLLASHDQTVASQENLELARALYRTARARFDNGAAPKLDLLNAQIQLASSEQAVIQAEAAEKAARTAFNGVLEVPADSPTQVQGDLALPTALPELALLQRTATETRPLLQAAGKAVEQARAQVRLTRIQRNPSPSLTALYDLAPVGTSPSFPANPYWFGVTLTYPLLDYGQIGYQAQHDQKVITEKEKTLDGARVTVEVAVKTAYDNYQASYRNATTFEASVLKPSEEVMKITDVGYRHGALNYQAVLIAQQNLKSARVQHIALLLTGRQNLDALEAAVGRPLASLALPGSRVR